MAERMAVDRITWGRTGSTIPVPDHNGSSQCLLSGLGSLIGLPTTVPASVGTDRRYC